jgi:hypothetical protein
MKELKIGIVGSRRRNTEDDLKILGEFLEKILTSYSEEYKVILVSGGCAKGADHFAEILNKVFELPPMIIHYPNKADLPDEPQTKDFRRINFARNTLIAIDSDILIAMVAPDRLGGTENTIKTFKRLHPKRRLYLL